MVSKKKRLASPESLEMSDTSSKKIRVSDGASTSYSPSDKIKSPKGKSSLVKDEDDVDVKSTSTLSLNDEIPEWPEADLMELMKRIEKEIPAKDSLRYNSRAEKLDWKSISFGDYNADQCKEMWGRIQRRLRRFRLLREVLEDAKSWVSKPWTNFYRSQKLNRHPEFPRRPLSTYMLFYMDLKDKVAKENPGMEMTSVSKCIAEMYKTLSEKKKKKYADMAAAQRKEYEEKLEEFYRKHPDQVPKPVAPREHKGSALDSGPRKPTPPFKLFYLDKEKRHRNDPNFDKAEFLEKCKEQWRSMSDKKKVVWINWALEEEAKYQEELKAYMSENPSFVPTSVKAVLTKEEKNLVKRVAGKPDKPPNSGYSLFSRLMLVSSEIKQVSPKERMGQISKLWKALPESEKKKYQEQVNHMLDQYKLEYATYLESLPEDKRQEELQNNQPKRKSIIKTPTKKTPSKEKESKKKPKEGAEDRALYKGEPEPPPVNAYQLFLKNFLVGAKHVDPELREKEAPRYWEMLPDDEKAKYRKRLNDIKQRYIKDYEKFLKSLSQEQLKDYSLQKASLKKEQESTDEEDNDNDNDSGSNSDDDSSDESKGGTSDKEQESDSDEDSSSDSSSESSDSSDSSDSEGENNDNNESGDSSSGSESD